MVNQVFFVIVGSTSPKQDFHDYTHMTTLSDRIHLMPFWHKRLQKWHKQWVRFDYNHIFVVMKFTCWHSEKKNLLTNEFNQLWDKISNSSERKRRAKNQTSWGYN